MHIGKKQEKSTPKYPNISLGDEVLEPAETEKDIQVIIDSKLTFVEDISEKMEKATCMFALIRRTSQHLNAVTLHHYIKVL